MKATLISFLLLVQTGLFAQTVFINPDGTHSIAIDHGAHKVIVNPDGSHTVVASHGPIQTITHPNGKSSQVINLGVHQVIVNADGSHSVVVDHGLHKLIVHPNGTTSQLIDHGQHKFIINPDGTQSTLMDHGGHYIILNLDGSLGFLTTHNQLNSNQFTPKVTDPVSKEVVIHRDGSRSVLVRPIAAQSYSNPKGDTIQVFDLGKTELISYPDGSVTRVKKKKQRKSPSRINFH